MLETLVHHVAARPLLALAILCVLVLACLPRRRRPRSGRTAGIHVLTSGRSGMTAPGNRPIVHPDGCAIAVRPVLNGEELALAARLDALLAELPPGLRLLAQVSLDEIFTVSGGADRKVRYGLRGTFAQKRVDFLVVDGATQPILGIEYQGSGHRQGNFRKRDAVKAETFERAGLPLVEIHHGYRWSREASALRLALIAADPARHAA